MFYDMQVMALGTEEAVVCPDFSQVQLLANMMQPRYEVIQFYLTDCIGDNCARSRD